MHLLRLTSLPLALALSIVMIFSISSSPPHPYIHKTQRFTSQTPSRLVRTACERTRFKDLCFSPLSSLPPGNSSSVPELIAATVNETISEVMISSSNCSGLQRRLGPDLSPRDSRALEDCLELLGDTAGDLDDALADLHSPSAAREFYDLQTLLSAAMTNQYTCLDGFAFNERNRKYRVRDSIKDSLFNISRHVSNSLAMLQEIPAKPGVFPEYGRVENGGFPTWVSRSDRRLLQAPANDTKLFDLVVAKDGTGNFTTVSAAVAAAPNSSTTRFVIYIKEGAYFENVEVGRKKTMLMLVGDGIGKTVVKANRNVVDGWTTFRSATVAVVGNGFIAKGITFENFAGPTKHQAVALRSGSDHSAFYLCSFVGYQDTLYVHSFRQFFRECDIYGTVDFIFGNAAVVFQNCNLYARKPNPNQKNIYTAQGREDPKVVSVRAADLIPAKAAVKTYLGRPWKAYSRTVFIKSYIDDAVDPAGWLEWNGDFALDTLYYGEYMNRGPGSNTTNRVKWAGYRVINSSTEASKFTVGPFVQGDAWLNSTKIPFSLGLG
ncbi:PREDICTED: pectinesterase-like [Tarenaya hassleriana]|uniref:pectinesterase-like n=1 Tax=Tarenaya hassleriana TaxID=28532 RepID=UPI00053CA462|nr:PREDICTED: pectinesterase-like [Tarenaya hassleriana]